MSETKQKNNVAPIQLTPNGYAANDPRSYCESHPLYSDLQIPGKEPDGSEFQSGANLDAPKTRPATAIRDTRPDHDSIMKGICVHSRAGTPKLREFAFERLLAKGETSALFGEPGATKSALAIDIACKVAWGISWGSNNTDDRQHYESWRKEHSRPTEDTCMRGVLYIAAERPAQVHRRINAFCHEHGIKNLDGLVVYDGSIDLSKPGDSLEKIVRCALEATWNATDGTEGYEFIDLVVIDTLAAAMSRPDSDTTATAAVAANLTNAASATGAHIMIVHHAPLNREKRLRGGHLTGAMDAIIHVAQKRGQSIATVVKDNDSSERPRLHYTLKGIDIECSDGGMASAPVIVPGKPPRDEPDETIKLTPHREAALEALVNASKDGPATEDAWRKLHDASDPDSPTTTLNMRFRRSRDWLEEAGLAEKAGKHWIPKTA